MKCIVFLFLAFIGCTIAAGPHTASSYTGVNCNMTDIPCLCKGVQPAWPQLGPYIGHCGRTRCAGSLCSGVEPGNACYSALSNPHRIGTDSSVAERRTQHAVVSTSMPSDCRRSHG